MSDNLRDRIAAVLASIEVVLDGWDNLTETSTFLLADAVIRDVLTPEFLADLVIEAIQKAADDA